MIEFARALFALSCHQISGRCLRVGGECLPLCARCLGLYSGIALVGCWMLVHWAGRRRPWVPTAWLRLAGVAIALCALDALSAASHGGGMSNWARFLLGYAA